MAPAPKPKMPLIQTVRRTSATVRTSEGDRVSGGVNARDMVLPGNETDDDSQKRKKGFSLYFVSLKYYLLCEL